MFNLLVPLMLPRNGIFGYQITNFTRNLFFSCVIFLQSNCRSCYFKVENMPASLGPNPKNGLNLKAGPKNPGSDIRFEKRIQIN